MPLSNEYYDNLKLTLETAANSKRDAIDAARLRASSAEFDSSGNVTGYKNNTPGSLDVQQQQQTRNLGIQNESSGTLRSGQYARELAGSQAAYRTQITDIDAQATAEKTQITNETMAELAKYKAMYGSGTTGGGGSTTGGTTGGGGAGGGNDGLGGPEDFTIKEVPKPNTIPTSTYTGMTPTQKAAVASRNTVPGGMGASAPKANTIPASTYTNMTPAQKAAVASRNTVVPKKPAPAPVPKKPAPAGNKNYR
jgi:hypothetical protein